MEASAIVLDGFQLRSDAKIVRWPDRYMDERGRESWGRVMALLPVGSGAGLPFGEAAVVEATGADSISFLLRLPVAGALKENAAMHQG